MHQGEGGEREEVALIDLGVMEDAADGIRASTACDGDGRHDDDDRRTQQR